MKTIHYEIFEQDLFGNIQWRATRRDGQKLFGDCLQVDFTSREEAIAAAKAEARRAGCESDITLHQLTTRTP